MLIHNADITGSLTINGVPYTTGSFSGSFIAGTNIMSANTVSLTGSFTGSFFGDGSQLSGVTSYTDADTLSFIQGYSGSYSGSFSGSFFGDGSNLSGVTSYTDADTLAFINSLDVVSGSIQTVSTVSDTFTSVTSYTVTHNFGTKEVIVSVYENDTLIFPSSINTPTTNTVTITFPEPVTGRVVVVKAGHIVSGSINYNSVLNKPTLVSGSSQISFTGITNKPTLVSGSSQITYSGLTGIPSGIVSGSSQVSFTGITNKPTLVSGSSQITYSGITGKPSGIVSGSTQVAQFGYATTGSNQFKASQTITGSLTVTGAIVAQTLNVQQVTSSVVFSSGSNRFGNNTGNTHQFTGSMSVTGSLTTSIAPLGSAATTFLTSNGGTIRSRTAAQTLSDIAALPLAGGTLTGALSGTSANFTGNIEMNAAVANPPNVLNIYNNVGKQNAALGSAGAGGTVGVLALFNSAGTETVTILGTGAATFSSSVTAAGVTSTATSKFGSSTNFVTTFADGSGVYFENTGTSTATRTLRLQGLNDAGNAYTQFFISHGAGNIRALINDQERIRIDGDGLKFNGDTAAANALDDYEEGTWTPLVTDLLGNTATTSTSSGRYTKIGNSFVLSAVVILSNKSAATAGSIVYISLPFTPTSGIGNVGFYTNLSSPAGAIMTQVTGAYIFLPLHNNGNNSGGLTFGELTNTSRLDFTLSGTI